MYQNERIPLHHIIVRAAYTCTSWKSFPSFSSITNTHPDCLYIPSDALYFQSSYLIDNDTATTLPISLEQMYLVISCMFSVSRLIWWQVLSYLFVSIYTSVSLCGSIQLSTSDKLIVCVARVFHINSTRRLHSGFRYISPHHYHFHLCIDRHWYRYEPMLYYRVELCFVVIDM